MINFAKKTDCWASVLLKPGTILMRPGISPAWTHIGPQALPKPEPGLSRASASGPERTTCSREREQQGTGYSATCTPSWRHEFLPKNTTTKTHKLRVICLSLRSACSNVSDRWEQNGRCRTEEWGQIIDNSSQLPILFLNRTME